MFRSKPTDCSTLPARSRLFREEVKITNDQYNKLPNEAKSDTMIPISEQGRADKDKAKALNKKLFDLSLQAEELSEEWKECNSKSTFTP